jgi:CheY-like chemotaxis protein
VNQLAVSGGVDPRLDQKTVLIVEDDTDLRDSLSDALGLEDYAVLVASNGKEALALLPILKRPCGIVLDIFMPVMSGTQFYQEIKTRPAWANIPVMIWTSDPAQAPSGLPVMKKPSNSERLFKMVAALF